MDSAGLRSFVARIQAVVDSSPPRTHEQTRTWVVDPLLSTLGWDSRGDAWESNTATVSASTGTTTTHLPFEYVLSIEETPALFVALEAFPEDLTATREHDLRRGMRATGVDRAIYTNGRTVVLLAGVDGADRFTCPLSSLEEATAELEVVSHRHVREHLEDDTYGRIARRLAIDREDLEVAIVDDLVAFSSDSARGAFRRATERFVDDLLREFGEREHTETSTLEDDDSSTFDCRSSPPDRRRRRPAADGEFGDARSSGGASVEREVTAAESDVASAGTDGGSTRDEVDLAQSSETDGSGSVQPSTSDGDSDDAATDSGHSSDPTNEDGEYVVSFFNDRGSVGAIGHSRPNGAMVHTAEYLFERGLSGIRLPWSPEDDSTVLNTSPTLADGTPMESPEELSNGLVLETGGTLEIQRARLDALATRAGFRAMFTGDWDGE